MAVLCDYTVIFDGIKAINAPSVFGVAFNTGGRRANSKALLIFNVRALNDAVDVSVLVNNQNIGKLQSSPVHKDHWSSQTIIFDSDVLSTGDAHDANTIVIEATTESGPFALKDIVCFFKQSE